MSADMLLHLRVCAANIPSLAAWDNWGSQLGSNTWPASSGLPQYVQSEVSLKWSCLPPIQLSSWQTTLMAGAWPLAVTLANVFLDPWELQYHLLSRAEELCCLGDLSYSTSFQPRAAEARRPGPTEEWKHKEGSILHKEHPRLPAPLLSAVAITGGHRGHQRPAFEESLLFTYDFSVGGAKRPQDNTKQTVTTNMRPRSKVARANSLEP